MKRLIQRNTEIPVEKPRCLHWRCRNHRNWQRIRIPGVLLLWLFFQSSGWECPKHLIFHGNLFLEPPKMPPPPRNRALTRPNEGTMTMLVNSPLVRPYFFDGVASPWDMIDWSLQNDYVVGGAHIDPWQSWGGPVSSWICFFLVIFYGIYYHGQSPRNSPPFGRFLLLFPSICLSKTQGRKCLKLSIGNHWHSRWDAARMY